MHIDLTRIKSAHTPSYVALKVLTADSTEDSNPVFEREILQHVRQTDCQNRGYQHVVHLIDSFFHNGPNGNHLCLAMELMGPSLLDVQKSFPRKQLSQNLGRQVAKQVLYALGWLHGSCGVIHTGILSPVRDGSS